MNEFSRDTKRLWLRAAIIIVLIAGCAPSSRTGEPIQAEIGTATTPEPETTTGSGPTSIPFELSSPAFESEGVIPDRFSCKGDDVSPELNWGDPPEATQSFALIFEDPGPDWVHWVVYNIPAEARYIWEAVEDGPIIHDGMVHGASSWGTLDYRGPCPPQGTTHRYTFTLYALDAPLDLEPGADKPDLLAAMDGHILAQTELAANFTR